MEYPFIFGTAGHIDHGKTALVHALTGIDCDRLEEEKRRGITIELGFAPLTLPSGKTVSIIDVPGHERFIRQMVAGAAGIDAAILVIAASEGVMPQTREHLDILHLLGVKFGLVALTKKDLVDDETIEIATAEVAEITKDTCLETAPIIPVSVVTGEGITQLIESIEKILNDIPPRKGFGAFFLPIDRVFGKKGLGSVVTGTSYQGSVSVGDEIVIMPSGVPGKVRSLQSHGANITTVFAGQRVALNLAAVSQDNLERGDVVCAKGAFIATDCMNVWLTILPSAPKGITHWQRVRLHVGTTDVIARISLLRMDAGKKETVLTPGSSAPVQILTESSIIVTAGQRFVIRFYSPLVTIGGGRIMLANAEAVKGRIDREAKAEIIEELSNNFSPVILLGSIIRDRGIIGVSDLFTLSQMERKDFDENLSLLSAEAEKHGVFEFGVSRIFIFRDIFDMIERSILHILKNFHTKNPELAGIEPEKLFTGLDSMNITIGDFKELLTILVERNRIAVVTVQGKTSYKKEGFNQSLDKKFIELVERIKHAISDVGFNLIKFTELEEKINAPPASMKRCITYLRENDGLGVLEGGLIFSRQTREQLLSVIAGMDGDITVAALRDAIGVNRKQSLAMLDFLDAQGLTQRVGDKRILTPSKTNKISQESPG